MTNEEITKRILEGMLQQAKDLTGICEVLEKIVSWMGELAERVSDLEYKVNHNDRINKRRVSKLVKESEWLEGVL